VFFLYTILIAILVVIGFSLLYIYKSTENYHSVVRAYVIIEYLLLTYLFTLYIRNTLVKKAILFSQLGFLLFCIYDYFIAKTPGLPFVPASIGHILLLIFIVYFFFEIMQEMVVEPIYHKAAFWISVAFIINSSGNFFLFLYSKNSYNDEIFKKQYTIIYTTVTVIKNLILCISILIKEKQEPQSPNQLVDIDLDSFHPIKNKT